MTAPFTITIHVFRGDGGWFYSILLWQGNVDTMNDPPTVVRNSTRAYRSPTTAWNAARTAADRMVR